MLKPSLMHLSIFLLPDIFARDFVMIGQRRMTLSFKDFKREDSDLIQGGNSFL